MGAEELLVRRLVVGGSALIYWGGVLLLARRIRQNIGRSPNLRPKGPREKLLWAGWAFVIAAWMLQPVVMHAGALSPIAGIIPSLVGKPGLVIGLFLVFAGYACTLWCYAAMGDAWRIGIDQREKNRLITRGPYGRIRHPIYLFQVVMLAGAFLLLPTPLSAFILAFHLVCVLIKSSDEESYLLTVHGENYREYQSRTGRLFPKLLRGK